MWFGSLRGTDAEFPALNFYERSTFGVFPAPPSLGYRVQGTKPRGIMFDRIPRCQEPGKLCSCSVVLVSCGYPTHLSISVSDPALDLTWDTLRFT